MSHHDDQPGPPRQPHHLAPPDRPAAGFDALMAEVLAGSGGRFSHRQHVQLTWLAVRRFGMPAAIGLVSDGIRRTARYAGAPQKYHETISRAWVELIAHHAAERPDRGAGYPDHGADHPARAILQPGPTRHSAHTAGHQGRSEAEFAMFTARNPLLMDKRLLSRFYHPATLASPAARTGWVEPDRAPFPWAAFG